MKYFKEKNGKFIFTPKAFIFYNIYFVILISFALATIGFFIYFISLRRKSLNTRSITSVFPFFAVFPMFFSRNTSYFKISIDLLNREIRKGGLLGIVYSKRIRLDEIQYILLLREVPNLSQVILVTENKQIPVFYSNSEEESLEFARELSNYTGKDLKL